MNSYVTLGNAYHNQGFFNIRQPYQHLIANGDEHIQIQLGADGNIIIGKINRSANANGTPRIMAGTAFKTWVNEHYELNEQMKVQIKSPNSLLLHNKSAI